MRVIVSERDDMDISFDTVVISPAEFNNVRCHLFIISNGFDEVVVELTDKITLGKLRPLMSRVKVVPKIVGDINSHTISLLCELYPDKSAELRYTMMRNPEKVYDIVKSMENQFHWSESY